LIINLDIFIGTNVMPAESVLSRHGTSFNRHAVESGIYPVLRIAGRRASGDITLTSQPGYSGVADFPKSGKAPILLYWK